MLATGLTLKDIPCGKYGTLDKYVAGRGLRRHQVRPLGIREVQRRVEDKLGTQMRAVGEVMSIGKTYKKPSRRRSAAWRPAVTAWAMPGTYNTSRPRNSFFAMLITPSSERHFIMYEALRKGATVEEIHEITKVKTYFIEQMQELVEEEEALAACQRSLPSDEMLIEAKKMAFPINT